MKSLTPVRTARLIASLIAIMGMFSFAVERVLTKVCIMAKSGVQMGLARYTNSFTGRFAAENFSDDKKLLVVLRQAKNMLPMADDALLILFLVSIVLFGGAAFGLVVPKQFCRVLVAMRLLKYQDGGLLKEVSILGADSSSKTGKKFKDFFRKAVEAAKKVQTKYWLFAGGALVFILILVFGVRGCSTGVFLAVRRR